MMRQPMHLLAARTVQQFCTADDAVLTTGEA
jgi:hypothetical protein